MNHPAFQNPWRIGLYFGLWLLVGFCFAGAMLWLIPVSWGVFVLNGVISGLVFSAFPVLLWLVIKFADFSKLSLLQRIINYVALGVLTVALWLGISYLLFYIVLPIAFFEVFVSGIALRVLVGAMLYTLVLQHYLLQLERENQEEDEIQEPLYIPAEEERQEETSALHSEILERIAVKTGQKIHVINVPEILYLQADGDYVMIHTADGRYLKEQTMKYFEEHLPANKFVRIHRSCIVNVEVISRVELYEKQNYLLALQNGEKLKASANGYKLLRKTLSL